MLCQDDQNHHTRVSGASGGNIHCHCHPSHTVCTESFFGSKRLLAGITSMGASELSQFIEQELKNKGYAYEDDEDNPHATLMGALRVEVGQEGP